MQEFDVDEILGALPEPDYNVAPTVPVPAILERVSKRRPELVEGDDGSVTRRLTSLTWGLVPSWAKDPKIGSRMINARVESVVEKPVFRRAFSARRCLLPADGFYEWYATQQLDAKGKPKKQPFFIHRRDGGLLVMAGLYEIWRDQTKERDDDQAWLRTCTVITTEATDAAGHIHDRMPMVVPRSSYDAWLDPTLTDPDAARKLLSVTDAAALEAYAVSTAVNSVKNNAASLLTPLGEEEPDRDPAALF